MDWSMLITAAITALTGFLGIVVGKSFDFKSKKLDMSKAHDDAVENCRKEYKGEMEKIKNEFASQLNAFSCKLDDIKTEQLSTSFNISKLNNDVQKLCRQVEKLISENSDISKDIAVLDNRTKVSEHRLDDLENINAKKKDA